MHSQVTTSQKVSQANSVNQGKSQASAVLKSKISNHPKSRPFEPSEGTILAAHAKQGYNVSPKTMTTHT